MPKGKDFKGETEWKHFFFLGEFFFFICDSECKKVFMEVKVFSCVKQNEK